MIKLILGLSLLISLATVHAQNAFGHIQVAPVARIEVALPGSLHDTMKAMSRAMKSIDVKDASKNGANAVASDSLAALAAHAKSFVPDSIVKLPAAQRGSALAGFKNMLDQVTATARSMAQAFRKGDNKTAAALYDQLNAEKKRGHGEYE